MAIDADLPANPARERSTTSVLPPTEETPSYILARGESYKHQYSNIYFLRLAKLRPAVEEQARERWLSGPDPPVFVPTVLEVTKGQICYIIGTVYMEMPLKPNVLDDIARDNSIPQPPAPAKFSSEEDMVTLEDESGRIKLVGDRIRTARVVTGVIVGVLGMETPDGDFEVVDICYPGLPPQSGSTESAEEEGRMEVDDDATNRAGDEWIALISGLEVGAPSPSEAVLQLLVEYLTGEAGSEQHRVDASQISRLIIAGNSFSTHAFVPETENLPDPGDKKARKHALQTASLSKHPTATLNEHLLDVGRVMPIHVLPGFSDPARLIMPQQPFPRGLFGPISKSPSFICETNPTYLRLCSGLVTSMEDIDSQPRTIRNLLIHSGQPLNDMFRYLSAPMHTRLGVLESTLRWRHMAPTCPDTLWCHPYRDNDPFIIRELPDIYIVGDQKKFGTKLVNEDGKKCRIILIPGFARTGVLVLVNLRTLDVKTATLCLHGMTGDGRDLDAGVVDRAKDVAALEGTLTSSSQSPRSSGSMPSVGSNEMM